MEKLTYYNAEGCTKCKIFTMSAKDRKKICFVVINIRIMNDNEAAK